MVPGSESLRQNQFVSLSEGAADLKLVRNLLQRMKVLCTNCSFYAQGHCFH